MTTTDADIAIRTGLWCDTCCRHQRCLQTSKAVLRSCMILSVTHQWKQPSYRMQYGRMEAWISPRLMLFPARCGCVVSRCACVATPPMHVHRCKPCHCCLYTHWSHNCKAQWQVNTTSAYNDALHLFKALAACSMDKQAHMCRYQQQQMPPRQLHQQAVHTSCCTGHILCM